MHENLVLLCIFILANDIILVPAMILMEELFVLSLQDSPQTLSVSFYNKTLSKINAGLSDRIDSANVV